ncbi:siderophore-interacting protein [Sinomicrobium soli]|uniref:siderophore-interacting protein n=1 Tax=Sinomicrobium sp. N-1-3-6 TaxID=2219864 RepID=UPI000DCB1FC5|nr:siderophore-interacting protein [Sinomicrobium sp. N-1-3-6]RAV27500.1 siderophore-interacting protein [Sinomicrobium sp. N-1-3-6]
MAVKNNGVLRGVLTVKRRTFLTPHYIRVVLEGNDVPLFKDTTIGVNNKILVPPRGVKEIHFPEYDEQKGEWIAPPEHLKPVVRTYTHRGINLSENEMIIDFAYHGDSGPASAWAASAIEGDKLGVLMKQGKKPLISPADWYLLVGDITAIPVLGAILETLPETARARVIIEIPTEEDRQELYTKADVDIQWVYNPFPGKDSELAAFVKKVSIPEDVSRFGYVAAEFSSVREIRAYLRKDLGWTSGELYAYSYWKDGVAEDQSVTARRKEKESI